MPQTSLSPPLHGKGSVKSAHSVGLLPPPSDRVGRGHQSTLAAALIPKSSNRDCDGHVISSGDWVEFVYGSVFVSVGDRFCVERVYARVGLWRCCPEWGPNAVANSGHFFRCSHVRVVSHA